MISVLCKPERKFDSFLFVLNTFTVIDADMYLFLCMASPVDSQMPANILSNGEMISTLIHAKFWARYGASFVLWITANEKLPAKNTLECHLVVDVKYICLGQHEHSKSLQPFTRPTYIRRLRNDFGRKSGVFGANPGSQILNHITGFILNYVTRTRDKQADHMIRVLCQHAHRHPCDGHEESTVLETKGLWSSDFQSSLHDLDKGLSLSIISWPIIGLAWQKDSALALVLPGENFLVGYYIGHCYCYLIAGHEHCCCMTTNALCWYDWW